MWHHPKHKQLFSVSVLSLSYNRVHNHTELLQTVSQAEKKIMVFQEYHL